MCHQCRQDTERAPGCRWVSGRGSSPAVGAWMLWWLRCITPWNFPLMQAAGSLFQRFQRSNPSPTEEVAQVEHWDAHNFHNLFPVNSFIGFNYTFRGFTVEKGQWGGLILGVTPGSEG